MQSPVVPPAEINLPDNRELPDELRGPVPREVPPEVKGGRLAQKRRNAIWGCFVAGIVCLAADGLPFVETLALYVLPLGYLFWIGIGFCGLAALIFFRPHQLKKACRYIERGDAAFARVLALVKTPTLVTHGQPTMHAFVARLQMRHPETGEACLREVQSTAFSSSQKEQIETPFRVGDAIPVVWIPGDFDRTLQIYDFLEVMPGRELVRRSKPMPLWQTVGVLLLAAGFFFALLWNLYAFGRYQPLDFDWLRQGGIPLAIGAVFGLAGAGGIVLVRILERRKMAERNAEAIQSGGAVELAVEKRKIRTLGMGLIAIFGAMLLGGATVLGLCLTANAVLDRSPSKPVAVKVTQKLQVTHSFLFREYKLKYRRAADRHDIEMLTTPQHLSQFVVPLGIARVRAGRFGWSWVETVDPIAVPAPPK